MPENEGEPLEVLSVGIEADIRNLLNGAREGVQETAEILAKLPVADLKLDPREALKALLEIGEGLADHVNLVGNLNLNIKQMGRVMREGAEEGASALQKMAAQVLEILAIEAFPAWVEDYGFSEEQWQQTKEYLRGLGDAFRGSELDAGLFVQAVADAEAGLSRLELQMDPELIAQSVEQTISAFYRLDQVLHGLPSARLSEVAGRFASNIRLVFEELEASAKDVGAVEALQAPAGGVIRFEVEGEDALEALETIQDAMVQMNLISKEATFSVEELVEGMAEPKFVEAVGTIEEVVEGFAKLKLTASELDQVVREGAWGTGVQELAAELVEYSRSFHATLGDMATHLNRIGRAGIGPLKEVLALFQELEKTRDFELPEIVPERTIEATRDSAEAWNQATREVAQAKYELEGVLDIYERFAGLGDLATVEEHVGIVTKGFSELATPVEAAAAAIIRYAYVMDEDFGNAAETVIGFGDVTQEMAIKAAQFLETAASGYSATEQEVEDFTIAINKLYAGMERQFEPGQRVEEVVPSLENIIQALNEITLTAEQTGIALTFTDKVHEGIASLVSHANKMGVSLGEAGRQLAEMEMVGIEGLERTLSFLQQLVDLTDPIEELAASLSRIELTPGLLQALTEDPVLPIEKLTADLVTYAEQMEVGLGDAARHFSELGQVGTEELLAIRTLIGYNIELLPKLTEQAEEAAEGISTSWEPTSTMMQTIVRGAEDLGTSLGEATVFFEKMGEQGAVSLEEVSGRLREVTTVTQASAEHFESVVQALNRITLNAEQTEIALKFSDEVHQGIAALVELAGELGIGLGDAGRQLATMGEKLGYAWDEDIYGLEQTLDFLEQLVDLTDPVEELAITLGQIQLTPELFKALTEDPVSPMEKLAADLAAYAEQSKVSLGGAARHFHELGTVGVGELLAIKEIIGSTIGLLPVFAKQAEEAAQSFETMGDAGEWGEWIEEIVERLNQITLSAQQTEIALDFTSRIHAGIAYLVELAGELGVGLGEAGRQLLTTGKAAGEGWYETIEGLEDTTYFLEQLVSLTGPAEESIGDLSSEVGTLAGEIVIYALEMGTSLEAAAQHFRESMASTEQIIEAMGDAGEWIGEVVPPLEATAEAGQDVVEVFYTLTEQMLHARPASVLAASMRDMSEEVKIAFAEVETSAKSMIGLLTLGVPKGGEIKITVDTEDAVQTLGRFERAMVDAELVTEEAMHSLEELDVVVSGLTKPTDFALAPMEMGAKYRELDVHLHKLQLTGGQTTAVLVEGAEETATAVQKLAASLLEVVLYYERTLSQAGQQLVDLGLADIEDLKQVQDYLEGLSANYQVSQQAAEEYWTGVARGLEKAATVAQGMEGQLQKLGDTAGEAQDSLEDLAKTHINPSPLAGSFEAMIEAVHRLNAVLDTVPERIERIAHTPLEIDLTQVEQLTLPRPTAVIPTGQVERFAKMARDLPMIFRPMEPILDQVRGRMGELFTTIREGISSVVPRIQQIVAGLFQVGEAASAATIGVQRCNQIIEQGAATSATEIQRLLALIVRLSRVSGESFESIAQGMTTSGSITKTQLKGVLEAVGGLGKGTVGLGGIFKTLGGVAQSVFGVALGISAVQALRRLIKEIKETVEVSIKLQTAMMRLDVAVHTVQRSIGAAAGTMGDWRAYVKELRAEFVGLSEIDLTNAASMVVFLTRELGFNEDQMRDVLRTAATLASVYDVEVGEAVGRVVRALTGYGRGLYSLGIFLSRATLDAEAFAMGLNKTWTQLTAEERAMVALNVIMRQTEPVVADLDTVMGSLGGQMQTVAARTADARGEIGGLFAPAVILAKNAAVVLIEVVAEAAHSMSMLVASVAAGWTKLYHLVRLMGEGIPMVEALAQATELSNVVFVEWSRSLGLIPSALEDILEPMEGLASELDQDFAVLVELAQKYGDQFADAIEAWTEGSEDAWGDLQEGLSELAEELSADLTESFEDFMRDLEDLAEEYADRRQDILDDAQRDMAELERDHAKDRKKDETDHWRDLLRLQEDYQRDARRLRERFIQTLKDAVAKRDVWGAIQAIRTYARDARYLKEDYETRRARMIEDFNARMIELDRQFEEKRRKIEEDRARELAELEIWLAERRAELEEDRAEREQELRDSAAKQEQELQESYDKRLRDLEKSLTDRMLAIAQAMADEEELTAAGAQAVLMALFRVFGYGGDIDQLMDAFQKRMARRINITVQVTEAWQGAVPPTAVPGMAEGGTFIAREPTAVMFGEAGTEIATFTPLNQLSRIDHTQRNLGLLDIKVSADEHFSIDFERRVEDAIASFVGGVIQ